MFLKRSFATIQKLSKLKKVSIPTIFHLHHFTDHDGLVHIDFTTYNRQVSLMCRESAYTAINDLVKNGYFEWKDGQLYSLCYHDYAASVQVRGYQYIANLSFLFDSEFMNLTKRQMLLIMHILHSRLKGKNHIVNVENLYKNKLHHPIAGIDIYYNYKEFKQWFLQLIEKGYFVVELVKDKVTLDQSTTDLEGLFDHYCGKGKEGKKRLDSKKTHPLAISINPLLNTVKESKGHIYDLINIAQTYNCYVDPVDSGPFEGLFGVKDELFRLFGVEGIQIYRRGLTQYFKDNDYRFYQDYTSGRLANSFKMYYIVPLIQQHMKTFLKDTIAIYNNVKQLSNVQDRSIEAQYIATYAHDGQLFELDVFIANSFEAADQTINWRYFLFELINADKKWKVLCDRMEDARKAYIKKFGETFNKEELPGMIQDELLAEKQRERKRVYSHEQVQLNWAKFLQEDTPTR